jgi:hypothetical protein
MSSNFLPELENILKKHSYLPKILGKVCAGIKADHQSITLGKCAELDRVVLNDLFPNALAVRKNKYILDIRKLKQRITYFDSWFEAVATLSGTGNKSKNISDQELDEIITAATYEFPRMTAAHEALRSNIVQLKTDIKRYDKKVVGKQILNAFKVVNFLKENTQLFSAAKLGAELCGDSKAIRKGTRLRYWISLLLAAESNLEEMDGEECLKCCGLLENKTASSVTVFGPFICFRGDKPSDWIMQLYSGGETAILSMDNLQHISRIKLEYPGVPEIVLCENETPFNQLVQENRIAIYTAGFPNSAVKTFISLLKGEFRLFHWGDTDPEGLEIAAILNKIKPLRLFRCEIKDCQRLSHALKKLNPNKKKRALRILESNDFPFINELEFTKENGWLEQEAWKANSDNEQR